MKKRYDVLRLLCAVGRVISVVACTIGIIVLFFSLSGGSVHFQNLYLGLIIVSAAASSYVSCEFVLVVVAIESHTRATAIMLRKQERRQRPSVDEDDAPDYELE